MNHTTLKKIALALTLSIGIQSVTIARRPLDVYDYIGAAIVIGGLGIGGIVYYLNYIKKPGTKKDIIITTSKEPCTSSHNSSQPTEEKSLIAEHRSEGEPTPAPTVTSPQPEQKPVVQKNTPSIPTLVKTQPTSPKTVRPPVMQTNTTAADYYLDRDFHNPFYN